MMNGNHLPAGQPMPGDIGGPASGPGLNGGRRRPPQPSYPTQPSAYQQHQQHGAMLYPNSYMNPYASAYYPPHPAHYQAAHIPSSHYSASSYNTYSQQRSPPPIHQTYPLIVSSNMQAHPQPYPRPPPPQQPSPALSTPPPFPTAASPLPPPVAETPTSTQSSQPVTTPLSPKELKSQVVSPPPSEPEVARPAFKYPLPWYSHPDEDFPSRASKLKRRRRKANVTSLVELPAIQQNGAMSEEKGNPQSTKDSIPTDDIFSEEATNAATSAINLSSDASVQSSSQETHAQSLSSTPVSHKAEPSITSTPIKTSKSVPRPAVPAVPVIPTRPKTSPKDVRTLPDADRGDNPSQPSDQIAPVDSATEPLAVVAPKPPVLWTNFFKKAAPTIVPMNGASNSTPSVTTSGTPSSAAIVDGGLPGLGNFARTNASSLVDALQDYNVSNRKLSFLEPRGLVNTGNMCYMNSVLQALIFCNPFYEFLDQVSKKAAHSFNSETPLIDAMVMLLREYKVIGSAVSAEQLQKRLKSEELEQYGDAFIPEFVYDAMKRLPRFATMQRGLQQDAEEFLGFLLQAIGDECTQVMRQFNEASANVSAAPTSTSSPTNTNDSSEWLEVGRKQRAAITRSSGHATVPSPISKIFTGLQRSVLRVHGQKESVTFQTYQSLQLDIGDAHVNNIVDALKHMTQPENMEFDHQRKTTKQVLIESLPPVLILHLKRFQFDPITNGTVKLWTKIDYPLELDLPDEMFSPGKKIALQAEGGGPIKYKLIAAVYHHGKSASGGHYTVDLRRQDDREWIRLDDTIIRRIRSEDVAEATLDKNSAKSAARINQKYSTTGPTAGNRFEGIDDEDGADEEGWNKVTSVATGAKKWSSVVTTNGPSTSLPAKNKATKDNVKDNKVAYLLFYERI